MIEARVSSPSHSSGGQREMAARVQFGLPALEDAETDLRALGVEQGGDGQAQLFAQAADPLEGGLVALVGAVGKVEARDVHAGADQAVNPFFTVGRGAEGADDLGFPQKQSTS